jgi:hypothetical protein
LKVGKVGILGDGLVLLLGCLTIAPVDRVAGCGVFITGSIWPETVIAPANKSKYIVNKYLHGIMFSQFKVSYFCEISHNFSYIRE